MADFRELSEGPEFLTLDHIGIGFKPVSSDDVPPRTLFLSSDMVQNKLCWKDGDGVVHIFEFDD